MTNYEPMMYSILKQFNLWHKKDDYIDLCYIGYSKALNNYDETKSKFGTYAYKCMKNEIIGELRKENANKRQRTELSFDLEYDEMGHSLKDIIKDDIDIEDNFIKLETSVELCEAIKKLTPQEQVIIKSTYNICRAPFTKGQLAQIFKIDQKEIDNINFIALKKLKVILQNEM